MIMPSKSFVSKESYLIEAGSNGMDCPTGHIDWHGNCFRN